MSDSNNSDSETEKVEVEKVMEVVMKERKENPWISFVKKVRAENGCSYKEAIALAKETYVKKAK